MAQGQSSVASDPKQDELGEHRTPDHRARERDELSSQVAEFLARGGKINEVEPLLRVDPPRKPGGKYGGKVF